MLNLWMFLFSALRWVRPWGSPLSSSGYTGGYWQASALCHHSNRGERKATWVMSRYPHCGKHRTSSSRASPVLCSTRVVLHLQPKKEEQSTVFHSWGSKIHCQQNHLIQTFPVFVLKGSGTNENNIPRRPVPIACVYLLWRERYHMAIAVCHTAPMTSPLKTCLALAQCHKLACPHRSWVVHWALQVLLYCLGPKDQVSKDNLHSNNATAQYFMFECKAHVAGMRGDGVFPQWGFSIGSNSPCRSEGLE